MILAHAYCLVLTCIHQPMSTLNQCALNCLNKTANGTLEISQSPILIQSKHDYNKSALQQCTHVLQFSF